MISILRCRRGTAAVEFAIVVPVFMVMLFGIMMVGSYLTVVHSVQQLAAEAVRASVGGLNDTERAALAHADIDQNITSYPLLSANKLAVSIVTEAASRSYQVTLNYDASSLWIYAFNGLVPAPDPHIVRSAAIQYGGY